jgi:hypothetical protein
MEMGDFPHKASFMDLFDCSGHAEFPDAYGLLVTGCYGEYWMTGFR